MRPTAMTLLILLLALPTVLLADPVAVSQVMRLGPLPASPIGDLDARVHAAVEVVPEVDPRGWLPRDDVHGWERDERAGGTIALAEPGVWWVAARLVSDRWCEVTLEAGESATIWLDGDLVSGAVAMPRGSAFVMVRFEIDEAQDVFLTADGEAALSWDLEPTLDFSRFDRARQVASISNLAVSTRGQLVARHLSRRHPTGEERTSETCVLDGHGQLVAAGLGGPSASPVTFTRDGKQLLLQREGTHGIDLLLWTAPRGPLATVVFDEPSLGLHDFDPSGRFLLMATERGLEAQDIADDQRRWDALRERVVDWNPLPHLQIVDLETGVRRVITSPGDYTLDDAAWLPDGRSVVYARTLPQVPRPWFHSEIRVIDLATGVDRLITTFTGGWEVRPQALTPHPDGRRLAFIGPPEEVGGGRDEHNVYNKQVWLLDLESGAFERVTQGLPYAFDAGRNLPAWTDKGRRLVLPASVGGRNVLVTLKDDDGNWVAEELPTAMETGDGWALSPDGEAVVYTAASPLEPRRLWLQSLGGKARELEAVDQTLPARYGAVGVEDASFTGPDGDTVEAWWYRPAGMAGEVFDGPSDVHQASVPLIVYYYAGSNPTTRGFNTTHQFWAANGYAVLVVNPRGAHGYGDDHADWHAGDWGPAAGGDIIAGTEALLARHPQLDRGAVGCYGGSYGGFMTMWLVSHSDLFSAAVSMYGIADLATYWGQGTWGWTYGDMAVGGRMPWNEPQYFTEHSPLYAAGDVNTPLLLLHGASDSNVTPGESSEMFTALQVQGKPVEMVTFAGEDHGIAGSWDNYVGHRTMMLEWFDRWLKGRGEAWERRWRD